MERPDTHIVASEHHSLALGVPNDETPVADQVPKTFDSPFFIRGHRDRYVGGLLIELAPQLREEILTIVEPSVPRHHIAAPGYERLLLESVFGRDMKCAMDHREPGLYVLPSPVGTVIVERATHYRQNPVIHRTPVEIENTCLCTHRKVLASIKSVPVHERIFGIAVGRLLLGRAPRPMRAIEWEPDDNQSQAQRE